METGVLIYSSAEARTKYGRVVELVDSLDSGSSVHCGRAGSSPASPTKKERHPFGCLSFLYAGIERTAERSEAKSVRWTLFSPWESP